MKIKSNKIRILWLSNSPGPNQSDFFSALSRCDKVDLNVLFCAKTNSKWRGTDAIFLNYNHSFLFNLNPLSSKYGKYDINPSILYYLFIYDYDYIVIQGYTNLTSFLSLYLLRVFKNKKYIFWGEMIDRNKNHYKKIFKRNFVYPLFKNAHSIFTMGPSGRSSFMNIGIRSSRIFDLPYCCDLTPFLSIPIRNINNKRKKNVLIISQLIKRKRVDIAIMAFQNIAHLFPDWDLIICGEGPQRKYLENIVDEYLKNRIHFKGFIPKNKQISIYQISDIFIITSSQDGWGMVVPEALSSGIPVISTDKVESSLEMLSSREAGIIINSNSVTDTESALKCLMSNPVLRHKYGKRAREIARHYDALFIANKTSRILCDFYKNKGK